MALMDKLAAAAIGAFVGELRATREVLQAGIDTFRQSQGMPLLYSAEPTVDEGPGDPKAPQSIVGAGDYLTLQLLEDLAREHGFRYHDLAELEQEARSRGWVDGDGKFLMLPATYAGMELGDLSILPKGQG